MGGSQATWVQRPGLGPQAWEPPRGIRALGLGLQAVGDGQGPGEGLEAVVLLEMPRFYGPVTSRTCFPLGGMKFHHHLGRLLRVLRVACRL